MDSFSNVSSTPEAGAERTLSGADVDGRSVLRAASAIVGRFAELVFPSTCVSCHGLVEEGGLTHLCAGCRRRIVLVRAPHCTTCGYPYFGEKAENSACPHCELLQPVYGEGRTATLLLGPMRRLVHTLKYDRGTHVLRDVEAIVRDHAHFASFLAGAVLVPVPLHRRKQRERGFNQADSLARCFAQVAGGLRVETLLERVIDTPTQTHLDRAQRQENLKNAFALAARGFIEPSLRYVLVDDVFTTGATLNACAHRLRAAGATRIDVATLGHG